MAPAQRLLDSYAICRARHRPRLRAGQRLRAGHATLHGPDHAAAPSTPLVWRVPAARRSRAEAVLEGWAKRMGFAVGPACRHSAAAAATLRALGRGVAAARVSLRVAMAAALWSEVAAARCRVNGGEAALLCRLEAAVRVPARLVLTVASWMVHAASHPAGPAADADADGQDHEEGWAECS